MVDIVDRIVEIVEDAGSISQIALVTRLTVSLAHSQYKDISTENIVHALDVAVHEGKVGRIAYTSSRDPHRFKSLYFPKGTIISIEGSIKQEGGE